jgi:phosphonate transport system ATP-binding protein
VAKELGITVLCNLHQVDYAREFGERIVGMSRGSVVFDGAVSALADDVIRKIYYEQPEEKAA